MTTINCGIQSQTLSDGLTQSRAIDPTIFRALIASCTVGFTATLAFQLVNLNLYASGVSPTLIGVSTAVQALGILIVSFVTPFCIRHLDSRKTLVAGILLSAFSALGLAHANGIEILTILRLLLCVGFALVFACAELTILALSSNARRGSNAGLYTTVLGIGMAGGVASVGALQSLPAIALALSALLCLLCAPLAAGSNQLALVTQTPHKPTSLLRLAPLAFVAAFFFGFLDNGPISLLTIFGLQQGWNAGYAAMLIAAVTLGAVACQLPIGWAVDRFTAARVFQIGAVLAVLALSLLLGIHLAAPLALLCVLALGAALEGIYTVGLAHLGRCVPMAGVGRANSLFVAACGAGELVGPAFTGFAIDLSF